MFDGMTILLTGGTGSFGKAFTAAVLKSDVKKVKIYSRTENLQMQMRKQFDDPRLRWYIGDVRDKERLSRAMEGCDYVIHAAAMKYVDVCEYDPMECIKTNINGAMNVVNCALDHKVKKVVALSTDKASDPCTLYGASKLVSDKLFINGNVYSNGETRMAVVRYGNVWGSSGSIVPKFKELVKNGAEELPITSPAMTRFNITMDQAVDLVMLALREMRGGEIFVPKIKSYRLADLVSAFGKKPKIIGIRGGEKMHEQMISENEICVIKDGYFIILPYFEWENWREHGTACRMNLTSNCNEFISIEELQGAIDELR